MKNHYLSFIIVLFLVGFTIKPFNASDKKYQFENFTQDQLKNDLKFLYNKLDTAHFNLFHNYPKQTFDSVYSSLMNRIDKPMNTAEFYFYVLPIFNLLSDAHSMLGFPFSYSKTFSKQGGKFLPLKIFIQHQHIYASASNSSIDFPLYSEIISLNGIKSKDLIKELELLSNREQKIAEEDYMSFLFSRILYPVYGFDADYKLEIITPDKQKMKVHLLGISLDEFPKQKKTLFDYYYLNESVAVIDINACEDKEKFASFCDSCFTDFKNRNIKDLVIDLRDNSGGSTYHGDTLLTYLTNEKFTQYTKRCIKYSPYSYPKSDSIYIVTYNDNLERNFNNSKKFNGNVYMLVNHNTFSSASLMAATFQCYNMGTLIGEETGGTQIFFDEPIEFTFPVTKLRFLVSNQVCFCPCGDSWIHGVIPDYKISPTIEDIISNKDVVLNYALSLIGQSKTK